MQLLNDWNLNDTNTAGKTLATQGEKDMAELAKNLNRTYSIFRTYDDPRRFVVSYTQKAIKMDFSTGMSY